MPRRFQECSIADATLGPERRVCPALRFRRAVIYTLAAIVEICLFIWCAGLRADSGDIVYLPAGNVKVKNGLRLSIDSRWVAGNGYRPIRVEAINWPPGPAAADRRFRIDLSPSTWGRGGQTVTQYLELPQGVSRAATTIAVPQQTFIQALMVQVYEDGVELKDLADHIGISMRGGYSWSESLPAILFIDADIPKRDDRQRVIQTGRLADGSDASVSKRLPDLRYLAMQFGENNYQAMQTPTSEANDLNTLMWLQNCPRWDILSPSELPDRWLDYSCLDIVCVSRGDLQQLVRQHPDRWQSIRDWVATGPTLVVTDVALEAAELGELDALLSLPPADTSDEVWKLPHRRNAQGGIRGLRDNDAIRAMAQATAQTATETVAPAAEAGRFAIRAVEMGRVVAAESAEPLAAAAAVDAAAEQAAALAAAQAASAAMTGMAAGAPNPMPIFASQEADWLFNEIGQDRWMWYRRHGLSLLRENNDYWNFNIPGVGRAPVGSYLILITLFVIAIGPLNYYWLRRKRRLYLLLVTVPLGAGLVTAALLNYALFTDGFAVRARIRSYCEIDQRSGQGVSWSRQAYYAGAAPSRGLAFPPEAAVYPLAQFPSESGRHRRLLWDGDQRLTDGYLSSRTATQFLVIHSRRTQRQLVVRETADADGAPDVENRLGVDLLRLVLRDSAGRLYWAENIPAGRAAPLRAVDAATATEELRRLNNASRPAFPEGYDANYYGNAFGFRNQSYYYGSDGDLSAPDFDTSILERGLNAVFRAGAENLPSQSYVAVARRGVETPLGYARAVEQDGFHVVRGTW